jgi:hypothetical protein
MMNIKKMLRYIVLGIVILLALCGIPMGTFLPSRKEMDEDPEVKTEIVEASEERD